MSSAPYTRSRNAFSGKKPRTKKRLLSWQKLSAGEIRYRGRVTHSSVQDRLNDF